MLIGAIFAEMSIHVRRDMDAPPNGSPSVAAFDGVRLRGVFSGHGDRGCVVLLHGIGDTHLGMSGFAEMLVKGGYRALSPDSRGHGWSEGQLVTYGVLESRDVSTWVDWLRDQGCTRIFGLGESLGGAVLLQSLAHEKRFSAVVADSAYSSFPRIAADRLNQMMPIPILLGNVLGAPVVAGGVLYARIRYGVNLIATSAVESVRDSSTPILLIDGLADSRTPITHSRRLAESNNRIRLWEVPGADHCGGFGTDPSEFRRRVFEFFT